MIIIRSSRMDPAIVFAAPKYLTATTSNKIETRESTHSISFFYIDAYKFTVKR